jgi:predicted thioredoxin/glutaredoxin
LVVSKAREVEQFRMLLQGSTIREVKQDSKHVDAILAVAVSFQGTAIQFIIGSKFEPFLQRTIVSSPHVSHISPAFAQKQTRQLVLTRH